MWHRAKLPATLTQNRLQPNWHMRSLPLERVVLLPFRCGLGITNQTRKQSFVKVCCGPVVNEWSYIASIIFSSILENISWYEIGSRSPSATIQWKRFYRYHLKLRTWTSLLIQHQVLPAAPDMWWSSPCKGRVFSRITAGTISVWTPGRGTRHREAANTTFSLALLKDTGPGNWQPKGKLLAHSPLLHKPAETRNIVSV